MHNTILFICYSHEPFKINSQVVGRANYGYDLKCEITRGDLHTFRNCGPKTRVRSETHGTPQFLFIPVRSVNALLFAVRN
jgi:hypothetical protein